MADKIGYARVSTADQNNPQLQLDALGAEGCLKIYTDKATGTRADRREWNACLADLRPGDTLVIWRRDRLGPARVLPGPPGCEDFLYRFKLLKPASFTLRSL